MDFGGQVRISAVTIQPFNDALLSRITSFKLQYSWQGVRWEYLKENDAHKVSYIYTHLCFVSLDFSTCFSNWMLVIDLNPDCVVLKFHLYRLLTLVNGSWLLSAD